MTLIRPPADANGTARDQKKRAVVLHDSSRVGCPSTTLAAAVAMSMPLLGRHRTKADYISRCRWLSCPTES